MSKREEAIEAITHAICEADGMHGEDYRACATAAFDAVIQFLTDNAGPLSDAGWQAGKESFDKRLLRKGSKESFKAMLAAASA